MLEGLLEKKTNKKPDLPLAIVIFILLALGILILASVSAVSSYKKFGDTYYFLKHQMLWGLAPGLLLGYLAFKLNLNFLRRNSLVLLLASFVLMILVFFPGIGSRDVSAARWIGLGPFSFQPSELLKLVFIVYLATWLAGRNEKKFTDLRQTFVAFLAVLGAVTLLLFLQSDISTLGVIIAVGVLMYFSIDTPLKHMLAILLIGVIALAILIQTEPYRIQRLTVFLNPDTDLMGIGYQLNQSVIAIGSGGMGGVGLGMSAQKLGFLPQTISDSIFAVFSEETGFIGGFVLIGLFLFFVWRGFKVAKNAPDKFMQLTALGIACWIIIQSFVNIGAMIGILPLTGIPLPFISYGGSAMVVELIAMGILLNISKYRT